MVASGVTDEGSAQSGSNTTLRPLPALAKILAALDDPAPRVTLLFTDGARLTIADAEALRRLKAQGPLLWMDYRDPHLWDGRHVIADHAGAAVWPATMVGLQEALRSIFVPSIRTRMQADRPALDRLPASTTRRYARLVLGDALDWACDCAVLQPISLGLVEQIRQALHNQIPWIAFSRFLALPETTLAHEGLRFREDIASFLRQRFTVQRPPETREKLTQLILNAINGHRPKAPEGTYGYAAWSFTRARVMLFVDPDQALPELRRIQEEGLIETGVVRRFVARITPPGVWEPAKASSGGRDELAVVLPRGLISIEARRAFNAFQAESLSLTGGEAHQRLLPEAPILWRAAPPLYREQINSTTTAAAVAFAAAGELLGRVWRSEEGKTKIAIVDLSSGLERTVDLPEDDVPLVLTGAGGDRSFVLTTSKGSVYRIQLQTERSAEFGPTLLRIATLRSVAESDNSEARGRDLAAISHNGAWVAASWRGAVFVGRTAKPVEEPRSRSCPGIQALAALDNDGGFIAGLDRGGLRRFAETDESTSSEPFRFGVSLSSPAAVTAIGVSPSPDGEQSKKTVAVAAGGSLYVITILSGEARDMRRIDIGWDPTLVEAFADGQTVALGGPGRFDVLDLTINGSAFERPPHSADVMMGEEPVAISDEGRRVAAIEGAYATRKSQPVVGTDLPDNALRITVRTLAGRRIRNVTPTRGPSGETAAL
jgi:hypothetical protein